MHLVIVFIAFCLIQGSMQTVKLYEQKTTPVNNEFACVNVAIKKYFHSHQDLRIFSTNSNIPLNKLIKVPLTLVTDWNLLRNIYFFGKVSVIIFLGGKADRDSNSLKLLRHLLIAEEVLIVCVTDRVCSSEVYMRKITDIALDKVLRYVAVDERGITHIYEYTSVAEGTCGVARFFKLGRCSDKRTAKRVFESSVNFHKCPIRAVTWPCPPYSEPCNSNETALLCGIAGSVIRIITEKLNATVELVTVQSPKDVRRKVANGDADLGFGGLDTHPFKGVSYSDPYTFVQTTVIASPSTWTLDRSFGNILQPLEIKVWVGIAVTMVLILILRGLIRYFRRIDALQLFGLFLAMPVPKQPRGLPSRIYFVSLVLFGYLCSQLYLTNLTKVLSVPHRRMIRTLADLEKSTLRVTGPGDSREKFKSEYPRIYSDFQTLDESEYYLSLHQLLYEQSNSVFYIEDLDTNIAKWKNVKALRDRMNWYGLSLAAPSISAVLQANNAILMNIWQSGILGEFKIFTPRMNKVPDWLVAPNKCVVLGFDHLKWVFILLIIGLALSFFIFLIEIVTAFIKKKPKIEAESRNHPEYSGQKYVRRILLPRRVDIDWVEEK